MAKTIHNSIQNQVRRLSEQGFSNRLISLETQLTEPEVRAVLRGDVECPAWDYNNTPEHLISIACRMWKNNEEESDVVKRLKTRDAIRGNFADVAWEAAL